jgi:hypothetical protein
VTLEMSPKTIGTHLRLTHGDLPGEATRDRHQHAWRQVLMRFDESRAEG